MGRNFAGPNIPENAKDFDLSGSSKSKCSLGTGLISSSKVSNENFAIVEEESVEKHFFGL